MWSWLLTNIISPIRGWLIAAVAALAAVLGIYLKGRAAGRAAEKEKLAKATAKIESKWNEVDRRDVDLDAALDGLRRAGRD